MKSLVYLTSHQLKNKFFELLKSPFRLILSLGFVLLLVMNLSVESISGSGSRSISEFYAIIFIFYILCFVSEVSKGFDRGGTMFGLCDVSFLFLSPIKPTAVLLHGMLGRLGSSMWMGLIFVYQFALLKSNYPIDLREIIFAVSGYGITAFLSQLTGMMVYFYTCGQESKIKKSKSVFYALCFSFLFLFLSRLDFSFLTLTHAAEVLTKPSMMLFPVAGWALAVFVGIAQGQIALCLFGFLMCLTFAVACFMLLSFSKHGYYEDVLLSAEKNADRKGVSEVKIDKRTLGKNKSGLRAGWGASAVLFKHLLENRRTKTTLISSTSLIYLALIGVYGLVFKGDATMLFTMSCTTGVFTVLSGRWLKELTLHHIYLIPEPPVKKLFFMLPELFPKIIAESVLQFLLIGFILKFSTSVIISMCIARITFCFLLLSSAMLVSGIFREKEKNNIFASVCIFVSMIFAVPSVTVLLSLLTFGFGYSSAFIAMAAVNVSVSAIVLFFSRNLLKFKA